MSVSLKKMLCFLCESTLIASCQHTNAEIHQFATPEVPTPRPVIYLADNLDEPDMLGWCIDTQGRGWSDKLHAHSCKPPGGDDVRFSYDRNTGQIRSYAFEGKCAELLSSNEIDVSFGLTACDQNSLLQKFDYDVSTKEIRPQSNAAVCVTVSRQSQPAGPFMSRSLNLEPCNSVELKFKSWIVENE